MCDRDSRPGGGANGGTRPRHRRIREATLDPLRRCTWYECTADSRAAPTRSNVRSAPGQSALPKTLRGKAEIISLASAGATAWQATDCADNTDTKRYGVPRLRDPVR